MGKIKYKIFKPKFFTSKSQKKFSYEMQEIIIKSNINLIYKTILKIYIYIYIYIYILSLNCSKEYYK